MAQPSSAPLKPCTICQTESCIVIPSIAAPKHFCLLHYFGTGIHRKRTKNKRSKLFVHPLRMEGQLPAVQDLFSEAFVALQKEIREESARGFAFDSDGMHFGRRGGSGSNSGKGDDHTKNAKNNDSGFEDPLAALLDAGTPSYHGRMMSMKRIKKSFESKSLTGSSAIFKNKAGSTPRLDSTENFSNPSPTVMRSRNKFTRQKRDEDEDGEGGFIRDAALPDKLRKFQENAAIDLDLNHWQNNATKKTGDELETGSGKSGSRQVRMSLSSASASKQLANYNTDKPSNPYNSNKRRNRTSTWNQVLSTSPNRKRDKDRDNELGGDRDQPNKKPKKTSWEEMEKQMIRNITSTATSSCDSNDSNAIVASRTKCSSCGSNNIENHGNITSRNNDVRKGEVWGMKDRGETVVERYRCLNCGKVWNEE